MSKKRFTVKRILLLTGIFMLCGMILTSVDDCEENYFDQYELPDFENDSEARSSGQQQGSRRTSAGTNARRSSGQAQQQAGQSAQSGAQRSPGDTQSTGGARSAQSGNQQASAGGTTQPGQARQPSGTTQSGQQSGTRQSSGQAQQPGQSTQSGAQRSPGDTPSAGARPAQSAQSEDRQASAGGTPQAAVSSIGGKEWKLAELRKSTVVTVIDRKKLESDGFGDLFTINFGERVTGKAAPNRFIAPYQAGANNALTIQPPAGTLMASIYNPERIREKDYFQYLINVKTWKLVQGRLELYSSDSNGRETVLVYGN